MFKVLRQLMVTYPQIRGFSRIIKLDEASTIRPVVAKLDEVDKDPQKDMLIEVLTRRQKELDVLENKYTCVGIIEHLKKFSMNDDGTVVSTIFDLKGKPKIFKNILAYRGYVKDKYKNHMKNLGCKHTPMQLYITQNYGFEKPFTGAYLSIKDMGVFSCIVCNQKIFMYDIHMK